MLGFRVFIIVQKLTYTQNTKCKGNEFAEKCTYRNTIVYFRSLNQSSLSLKLFCFQFILLSFSQIYSVRKPLFLCQTLYISFMNHLHYFTKSFTFNSKSFYLKSFTNLLTLFCPHLYVSILFCYYS